MLFQFKTKPEDFIVKEELWFKPSGKWDVFFVRFQKKEINTMDIVQHLCYGMKLERKELGIAGLKDKNWVTEQRISIYKKVLNRIWGEQKFLEVLWQKATILETAWHNEPLAVWKNAGNYFKIRLEAKKEITPETKEKIESNIQKILKNWFPNCFGKQRFGKGYRNFYRAKEIFEGTLSPFLKGVAEGQGILKDPHPDKSGSSFKKEHNTKTDDFEIRFKLQAYASMYFNEYTIKRRQKWQIFLWWDIMVNSNNYETKVWIYNEWKVWLFNYEKCKTEFEWKDLIQPYYLSGETIDITKDNQWRQPTWPMLGFNLLTPPLDTKSRIKDNELLQKTDFENLWIKTAKKYNIYGFRRPLRTKPKNLKYERNENNDLILSFSLPTGSYATIFLWTVLDWIDDKTIIENGLEIPLIK
jgi:tRNA(Glu) U13 pseudouridine synthase TruD